MATRQERIPPYHPDYMPNFDSRAMRVSSPKDLTRIFQERPLDKKFLGWVAKQGFKIVYKTETEYPKGGGLVSWGIREIWVSASGPNTLKDLILAHELVHIAISPANLDGEELEKIIDEIAQVYANNSEFMEYAKEKLPVSKYIPT